MKKIILTMLTCLVLSFSVNSQDFDLLLAPNDTAQQIRDIDKIWNNIKDNINNFQRIEVFKDSISFKNVYLNDNVLQLVKVKYTENKVEKNVEWYFLDEQLIYAESIWINIETNKTVGNTKCYFNNLHMIAWFDENKYIDSKSSEFKERETQLVTYSKKLWVNAMK